MIPAILSCVFVIYMYRSLNSNSESLSQSSGSGETSGDPVTGLIDRLSGLQKRLDALPRNDRKGAGQ